MGGRCFGVHCCSYLGGGGWGFHVLVNLLVALVFGYGTPNYCIFWIAVFTQFIIQIQLHVTASTCATLVWTARIILILSILNSSSTKLTHSAGQQLSSFSLLAREFFRYFKKNLTHTHTHTHKKKIISRQFQEPPCWNLSFTCYQHVYCITQVTHRVRCCVWTPDTKD